MSEMKKEYLNVKEAAQRLGVTPEYVRETLKKAKFDKTIKLRGTKFGKEWRIDPKSINSAIGINVDEDSYKKDIRIKELEGMVNTYKIQISTFINMAQTFQNLVDIDSV